MRRISWSQKTRYKHLPAHLERHNEEAVVPDVVRFCPTHGEPRLIGFGYVETLMSARLLPRFPRCGEFCLRKG